MNLAITGTITKDIKAIKEYSWYRYEQINKV